MSQSNLYLVRVWQVREGFRAEVREVASEDIEVFSSRDELARFFIERAAAPARPAPGTPSRSS